MYTEVVFRSKTAYLQLYKLMETLAAPSCELGRMIKEIDFDGPIDAEYWQLL
jgi:hypothetical protein